MRIKSQTWSKDGPFLFDYESDDYKVTNHIIKNNSYIIKRNNIIKIIKTSNIKNINIKKKEGYIGIISINKNEEFFWEYNNYFEKNKFIKPIDYLDWIVLSSTLSSHCLFSDRKFDGAYNLCEGDIIKLGKILFLVRKIKINKDEIKKEKDSNSINNNININMNIENNSLNSELIIYRYNKKENTENVLESLKTLNEQKNKIIYNDNNDNNNNINSNEINNKLKNIYLKLKNINETTKLKPLKCRICLSEGTFEGKNPLISPCNCMGSMKYIHLNCLRKWLTSKVNIKISSDNNIYYYSFQHLECEICKSIIPEQVEYRGKIISLLDFKDIEPPYLILQAVNYNTQNKNLQYNIIFIISFKEKNYLIMGRSNNSDIKLNDISVSRNHSIIRYNNGKFYIDDIGSKFGTLLLIQNNILFLPYKEINIQTGKCHLAFYLVRTCLGCFKCYKNKLFDKITYEKYLYSQAKIVYTQMLENLLNNIVDPIEKYNSIINSYNSNSENNNINNKNNETEQNKDDIKNNSITSNKIDINNNDNNNNEDNKTLTLNMNGLKTNENNLKINNTGSFIMRRLTNSLIDENNYNLYNNSQKQNESNEMLFQDINNSNINSKKINKNTGTYFSIMNILKKNNKNKKTITVPNKKKYNIFNKNYYTYSLNDKNKNNILPNSQRNNNKIILDDIIP